MCICHVTSWHVRRHVRWDHVNFTYMHIHDIVLPWFACTCTSPCSYSNTYKPRPKIKLTKNLLSPSIPDTLPQLDVPEETHATVQHDEVELDEDGLLPAGVKKVTYDDDDEYVYMRGVA